MVSLPPPRTTELYYGGAWHTTKAREADPVTIERGVSAEGTTAGPSAATQTLDNTAGDLSPRDPSSPLHGAIGRNTPGGSPSMPAARGSTSQAPGTTD